jgi:DNA-binding NarL/FixJ family response regulator
MKLLLLEDHEAIRETVIRYIHEINPTTIVLEANNVEDADQVIKNTKINYAICDLELTKGCNINPIEALYRERIPFMVYSSHVNKSLINELESKKVRCYVSKQSNMTEFKMGLEALFNGGKHYCPIVTETLKSKKVEENTGRLRLSNSERKVIELLSKGQTREEVAGLLHLELATINNHIFRARVANGSHNVSDLLRRYRFWTPE